MPKSYEERKAAWAEKMKASMASRAQAMKTRSEDRLPPGQHLTTGFPVLDLGIKPQIPTETWSIELTGLVENEITLNWDALTDETTIGSLGFDSLSILDLIYDVQQAFGIDFEAEELVNINTVGELTDFLEETLKA